MLVAMVTSASPSIDFGGIYLQAFLDAVGMWGAALAANPAPLLLCAAILAGVLVLQVSESRTRRRRPRRR